MANCPSSTPVRSAPAQNAGGAPVSTITRVLDASIVAAEPVLDLEEFEERRVVERVSAFGPIERDRR